MAAEPGGPPAAGPGGPPAAGPADDAAGPERELQGTVADYSPVDGGRLLLDDGSELQFAAAAVRPPVRLLRLGQRVRLRLHDGTVEAVTLLTVPW